MFTYFKTLNTSLIFIYILQKKINLLSLSLLIYAFNIYYEYTNILFLTNSSVSCNTFYKRILSTTTLCASLDIKFVPHAPKFQPEDKVDGSKRNLQNVSATFDSP